MAIVVIQEFNPHFPFNVEPKWGAKRGAKPQMGVMAPSAPLSAGPAQSPTHNTSLYIVLAKVVPFGVRKMKFDPLYPSKT